MLKAGAFVIQLIKSVQWNHCAFLEWKDCDACLLYDSHKIEPDIIGCWAKLFEEFFIECIVSQKVALKQTTSSGGGKERTV